MIQTAIGWDALDLDKLQELNKQQYMRSLSDDEADLIVQVFNTDGGAALMRIWERKYLMQSTVADHSTSQVGIGLNEGLRRFVQRITFIKHMKEHPIS